MLLAVVNGQTFDGSLPGPRRLFMPEARTLDRRRAVAIPRGAPGRGYF
jgi:hypothetical protein